MVTCSVVAVFRRSLTWNDEPGQVIVRSRNKEGAVPILDPFSTRGTGYPDLKIA